MVRYFFDIDDGEILTEDDDGVELENPVEAKLHAIAVLPNLARDVLPDGDRRMFVVTVRNATGDRIFRASLSFQADWLIAPPVEG